MKIVRDESDIELVIKIPQKWFDDMVKEEFIEVDELCAVIQHGTPLPEGHGRIGDIDELHSTFKKACDAYNINNISFISDVDMHFDLSPTIIESYKAESEG